MRTVGEYFRSRRIKKKLSYSNIEEKTRIKGVFIKAIEDERWGDLPEYPVVLGFVKSLSNWLGIDSKKAVALLRRDYPPKVLPINPKPDVSKQFVWSPKLTFFLGVSVVIVAVAAYLGMQYKIFVSPPHLEVDLPKQGQEITTNMVLIEGKTDLDAVVEANNQSVITDADGNFSFELEVNNATKQILIIAKSRSGKETKIIREINPKF